jgi:AAA15 family ATPase/GTPase
MIRPLGRRGEGLFKHIKELISNEENGKELMEALNEGLSLLDWFKEFEIPSDLFTQEQRLNISDRFLKESKQVFDEKSTNEGFLFLLFYLVLFNSPKTPSFFAIDNIETSFNPKLSQKLISYLITVAKKNNKQVILTTHSPYILDGLDLSDDEQRLFVVRRNSDGHTKVSRVPYRENRTLQLSEVWMSGTLGGLPDNF